MEAFDFHDLQEVFERGHVLVEREVHVEFGAAVAAVEGPYSHGEDALKEFLSEQLIGAACGDDAPGRQSLDTQDLGFFGPAFETASDFVSAFGRPYCSHGLSEGHGVRSSFVAWFA